MGWLTPDMVKTGMTLLVGGVSLYASIRADLARLSERTKLTHEAAEGAHERIDRHLEGHL